MYVSYLVNYLLCNAAPRDPIGGLSLTFTQVIVAVSLRQIYGSITLW